MTRHGHPSRSVMHKGGKTRPSVEIGRAQGCKTRPSIEIGHASLLKASLCVAVLTLMTCKCPASAATCRGVTPITSSLSEQVRAGMQMCRAAHVRAGTWMCAIVCKYFRVYEFVHVCVCLKPSIPGAKLWILQALHCCQLQHEGGGVPQFQCLFGYKLLTTAGGA